MCIMVCCPQVWKSVVKFRTPPVSTIGLVHSFGCITRVHCLLLPSLGLSSPKGPGNEANISPSVFPLSIPSFSSLVPRAYPLLKGPVNKANPLPLTPSPLLSPPSRPPSPSSHPLSRPPPPRPPLSSPSPFRSTLRALKCGLSMWPNISQ